MKKSPTEYDHWMNSDSSDELILKMRQDWEQLEGRLNIDAELEQGHIRKKLKSILTWSAAAVILISMSVASLWFISNDTTTIRARSHQWVDLPDGSRIELFPNSKIIFQKDFKNGDRHVALSGEAVFEVKEDTEHPFMVAIGDAKIKVTGTSFRVSALPQSNEIAVQVNSGKVLFYNSEIPSPDSFKVGLMAGDIGIYSSSEKQINKKQILSTP